MDDIDDLTESDIPDLSDDELERVVAEWLGSGFTECRECGGHGYAHKGRFAPDCSKCGSLGEHRPNYTSDPAAAWRLLKRMPGPVSLADRSQTAARVDEIQVRVDTSLLLETYEVVSSGCRDYQRGLVEVGAKLAVHGVEPREVTDAQ